MAFKWIDKLTGVEDPEGENYQDSANEGYSDHEDGVSGANKMILLEPRAYSESQQIADYLKGNSSVVVNLKRVTAEQACRIVDFLSGTLYAIGGDMQKLGGGIFLCTPESMSVEGSISDDGNTKASKSKKQDDDEDFNW